jgi:hypothetical protein
MSRSERRSPVLGLARQGPATRGFGGTYRLKGETDER